MDPVGLALENFDATGRWRTMDAGAPIDASGMLTDGTLVTGPVELRNAIVARSDQFVRKFAENLFIYALGRGLVDDDRPAVQRAVTRASAEDFHWSAMIQAVVGSEPFQMMQVPTRTEATH
jgi:hypothetical protein